MLQFDNISLHLANDGEDDGAILSRPFEGRLSSEARILNLYAIKLILRTARARIGWDDTGTCIFHSISTGSRFEHTSKRFSRLQFINPITFPVCIKVNYVLLLNFVIIVLENWEVLTRGRLERHFHLPYYLGTSGGIRPQNTQGNLANLFVLNICHLPFPGVQVDHECLLRRATLLVGRNHIRTGTRLCPINLTGITLTPLILDQETIDVVVAWPDVEIWRIARRFVLCTSTYLCLSCSLYSLSRYSRLSRFIRTGCYLESNVWSHDTRPNKVFSECTQVVK